MSPAQGRRSTALAPGRGIGRFSLKSVLGEGAQAVVWRAWDPQLERDVALKLLKPELSLSEQEAWLEEARVMAGLSHPNIVAVHEACRDGEHCYLVLECIEGQTMADRLAARGALSGHEAAGLMLQVLDALVCAHGHQVVHRDLKPSNVLIGADGRARVMDFGIATRLTTVHDGRVVGSASTISPEAADGEPAQPAMDIFAAGMVLGQALLGRPLRAPATPERALHAAMAEPVGWPGQDALQPAVDERLRAMVMRAVAHRPSERFASAAEFRDVLSLWLSPAGAVVANGAGHATLEFLLRRMRNNGDFPALSDAVLRIQRITASDTDSLGMLSGEIMKDVALTNKLLRLVNTVRFSHLGGGEVSSISRAAALVGFAGIRNLAMSVLLIEHMKDQALAHRMRGLFFKAMLTAILTDQLTPPSRESEEAFLAGMFSHLGALLAEYYFPDESAQIRSRTLALGGLAEPGRYKDRDRMVIEILGASLDELGLGVAKAWDLPDTLCQVLRKPEGPVPQRALSGLERLKWTTRLAGLVAAELTEPTAPEREAHLSKLAADHARALALSPGAFAAALRATRAQMRELAHSLGIELPKDAAALPLPSALAAVDAPTQVLRPERDGQVQDLLASGIAEVTDALATDAFRLNDVLRTILETLRKALDLRHVVLAVRDPRRPVLVGRLAVGEGATELGRRIEVSLQTGAQADLFTAACLKGMDTQIEDAHAPLLQERLPGWCKALAPQSFLLLPLMLKGAPFALIYADRDQPIRLSERELSLTRTLRNQAVMGFKSAQ